MSEIKTRLLNKASELFDIHNRDYLTHEEDIRYYSGLLDHLSMVLDYFGEGE